MLRVRTLVVNGTFHKNLAAAERWARRPFHKAAQVPHLLDGLESNQRIGTDSAIWRFVTYFFTRLPCMKSGTTCLEKEISDTRLSVGLVRGLPS